MLRTDVEKLTGGSRRLRIVLALFLGPLLLLLVCCPWNLRLDLSRSWVILLGNSGAISRDELWVYEQTSVPGPYSLYNRRLRFLGLYLISWEGNTDAMVLLVDHRRTRDSLISRVS